MTIAPHDRTLYHLGTEDATTLTLSAQIGRYAAGMTAQAVLEDMAARLAFIEAMGCGVIIDAFTVDAVVYGPRSFTLDAVITVPIHAFTVNAAINGAVATSFSVNAYLVDHVGGQTTLASSVSSGASSIVVVSTTTFPFATPYTVEIGGTTYTVTAGGGGTTWTISPNAAANYSSGTAVNEVC